MDDLISRQAAIRWVKTECNPYGKPTIEFESGKRVIKHLEQMPPAPPERKIYRSMSEEEFEAWLYNHGICHPDIHESIACDIVPSLIDDAINELPPAPPEHDGFYEFLFNVINPNDMEKYIAMYHSKGVKE